MTRRDMFSRYVNVIVFKRRRGEVWTVRARLRWKDFRKLPREAPSDEDCDWAIVDSSAPNWEFEVVNGVKSIFRLPSFLWRSVRIPGRVNRWAETLLVSLLASLIAAWLIWKYGFFR